MKGHSHRKRCRKICYLDKDKANAALKRLRGTGAVRFYKCPYCREYHLTGEKR